MDHAEVREQLDVAAVEPGGLDRLMAGDTPAAAAIAGHLAGCPACVAELESLRRVSRTVRRVVRETPSPELRARTLGYVAAVGRPRGEGASAGAAVGSDAESDAGPAAEGPIGVRSVAGLMAGRPSRRPWLAAMAAAIVLSVLGTAALVGAWNGAGIAARDRDLAAANGSVAALAKVTSWTLRVESEPDSRRVALLGDPVGRGYGGQAVWGTLVFSPSSGDLVVLADGLTPPAAGLEYRCWVEANGSRRAVGRMFFGGALAYWVGPVSGLASLGSGATFGVSLVDLVSGQPTEAAPTLSGSL